MNVLVVGSGGREHALCWKLKQSPLVQNLYVVPGNAGIAEYAKCTILQVEDHDAIVAFCQKHDIDLAVIGPEVPLVGGLVDALARQGIKAFGPDEKAARLEASKAFTKEICKKYNIPTAFSQSFIDKRKAKEFVRQSTLPIVIKADGLAAGKGVVIATTEEEAVQTIEDMLEGKLGVAGSTIVIEEFLEGEEVSFFALCDGEQAIPFGSAQDHKRVGDGDTGPNTGGMGTYSPAPVMTPKLQEEVMERIILPTIEAMKNEGCPFKGVLFAGLMITKDGPKLLEYNVRFGDPETQSLLPRLASDLLPVLLATTDGSLNKIKLEWKEEAALCVVMAAKGYPGEYHKGTEIRNLDALKSLKDVIVFHAGTRQEEGKIVAAGGRVLGITALGENVEEAQERAYQAVSLIDWPEGFYRRDIGWRAVGRKKAATA